MPANYGNSRDYVAVRPIPSTSHVGLKVTARCSTPVYTCESPSRNEVAKQNHERRSHQISACGYRSVNHKPYKEVGDVILDEKELILKALGQYDEDNQELEEKDSRIHQKQLNSNFQEGKDIIAISQPKIKKLQTLSEQLNKRKFLLNKVKLGIDLFKLIRQEQERKARAAEEEKKQNEIEAKTSMRTAEDTYCDHEETDEETDLSKYVVSPIASKGNGCSSHGFISQKIENRREGGSKDVSNTPLERSSASLKFVPSAEKIDDKNTRMPSTNAPKMEKGSVSNVVNFYPVFEDPSTAKAKISKSKKYRNNLPRPFSPIFTNVNFYETQSREHTFRQLCALHWILEAMSLDQPASMPPISTCWNLKELKEDLTAAQWKADRNKAIEPIWRTFLSNPKRFTRGKAGKRGTLLQRRVSIAPNALRKISSASFLSQSAGSRLSCLGDDLKGTHVDVSKQGPQNRSSSRNGGKGGAESSDLSKTHNRSMDNTEEEKLKQTQIHPTSLKEKAFIVREVVVARNLFGRRESKFGRGRPSLTTSSKTALINENKDGRTPSNSSKAVKARGLKSKASNESKASGPSHHGKSSAAGVVDADKTSVEEDLPLKYKETFDELSSESALVLHDNLEQKEKTSVESMERKFHALHVMNDVNKAISAMRSKSRLKVETDEEKKARFSEECSWYKSLLENLPIEVRNDNYNSLVLDKIAKYGSLEGRKISNLQLIKVLSTLRPWELCYPDISAAIEFVRDKIVEMDKSDFEAWFQSRIGESNYLEMEQV